MAGAGTPDSHLDLAGKELASSYMHFHVTPAKNQSSLVLPREGRGTSQLSVRGTGRGWQILQLIHEMQNRGMLYKPDGTGRGYAGKAVLNRRVGLLPVDFLRHPGLCGSGWKGN